MASAAEQLASSISLANFSKATELKKRLWFTLGALILFRLLSFVPVPGIDPVSMQALYQTQSGGILDVFNTFSGGALERFSIVALGVMPYITASIVVQLGATLYGPWQALRKEGETGRKKLNQYTRYLTVMITLVQGFLAVRGLESQSRHPGHPRGRHARPAVRDRRHRQPGRRNLVPDVDRRADHQPRDRQRRLVDHHGRASSPGFRRPSPSCSRAAGPGRSAR